MLLGFFWGPVAGARPSATVPRSEETLCDDTPAQVNGGSVRDGICEPRLWNMGASLTLALEVLDPLKHPVHGNIELGVLSICSLDMLGYRVAVEFMIALAQDQRLP